jgi:hypothetical protein
MELIKPNTFKKVGTRGTGLNKMIYEKEFNMNMSMALILFL